MRYKITIFILVLIILDSHVSAQVEDLSFSTSLNRPDSINNPAEYSGGEELRWNYRLENKGSSFNTNICFFIKDQENNRIYDITKCIIDKANEQYCPDKNCVKLENRNIGTIVQPIEGNILRYIFPNSFPEGRYELIAHLRNSNDKCSNSDLRALNQCVNMPESIIPSVPIKESANYFEFNAGSYDQTQGLIDLVIDSETYLGLKSEVDRFKDDLEKDTGNKVKIVTNKWLSPLQVRNTLFNDFAKNKLIGAILIGNVPITYQITDYLGQRYPPTPSNYYYERLKDEDWIQENDNTIVQNIEEKTEYKRDIWTSRLLPPGNDVNEKRGLLRGYFNRNHNYRNGDIRYDGMLYLDSSDNVYANGDVTLEINNRVAQIAAYTGLYTDPSKVETAYDITHERRKEQILKKMIKNYEIASFNIHGTSTEQWVGGNTWINKIDLLKNPPGALFIALESCGNGDITNNEYLAGWYLFLGKSLLVRANSVPTFYLGWGSLENLKEYIPIASGIDFGTLYKISNNGQQSLLLGDPTLTIRSKDIENGPKITPITIIDLGDVNLNSVTENDILKSFTIKNDGKSELRLLSYGAGVKWSDNSWTRGMVLGISIFDISILPGQERVIPIYLSSGGTTIIPGPYSQYSIFYTNDPNNPSFKIMVKANFIR